jgi:DNA invertase Pin-like site-specific DNA recombinase
MLQDAKLRGFDLVIVRRFDRFARNVVDARLTEQHLDKYKVKLMSAHESFDDSTTAGWFSKHMVHLVNEWYSRNLATETISGMETNTRKGFRCGGSAPYGYKNIKVIDETTGKMRTKLELHPHESEAARLIFRRYAAGVSLGKIIKELESKNYKPRKAKKWSKSQLSQMLRNETYTGTITWRKTPGPETWVKAKNAAPEIVDEKTWLEVQSRIDNNPSKNIKGKGSAHPLTGLIACKLCGKNYVIKSKQNGRWRLFAPGT